MSITILAYGLFTLVGIYLLAGLCFCIILFAKGLPEFDPNTKNAGVVFKILIIPGIMAFWPLLWRKWKGNKKS